MFARDINRWFPLYAPEGSDNGGAALDDIAVLEGNDEDAFEEKSEDADDSKEDDATSDEVDDKEDEDADKKEDDEEVKEDDDEKDEKEEEDDDKKEDDPQTEDFSVKALKKAFPDIFKKFPEVKDAIFREREFTKLFGSVEDAREAIDKVEIFDEVSSDLATGNPSGLLSILEGDQLEKFANNFLPALQKKNKDLFFGITDRILTHVLHGAVNYADKNADKNLALAAKYISKFAFGETEIPSLDKKEEKKDPRLVELENERANERRAKYEEIETSIHTFTDDRLTKIINDGLDPDDTMTSFVKSAITDKIKAEVGRQIERDKPFQAQISSLWRRAAKENFSKEAKSRITTAYLARARRIIPSVRAKIRSEAEKPNGSKKPLDKKRQIDSTSRGNSGKQSLDPKKIDWHKVSDEDILAGE